MKKMIFPVILVTMLVLVSGCATMNPQTVKLCRGQNCETLGEDRAVKETLLVRMAQFIKDNLGADIPLFETASVDDFRLEKEPEEYDKGISFYVQGGPMPGMAVLKTIKFIDLFYIDRDNLEIKFKFKPEGTWVGMPLFTAETEGTISIKSAKEIRFAGTFIGSWLVAVGAWKYEWLIDYVDFDKRILGGNFSIGGGGLMNIGGGKGYQLVRGKTFQQATVVAADDKPLSMKPSLVYHVSFTESSGDGIIEGGEEVSLKVEVENKGEGTAKDVQVLLSGHQAMLGYLGNMKSLGDLARGEKKSVEFKAALPLNLQREIADIKIEVGESGGFSASDVKTLKLALKPGKSVTKETEEVISQLPLLAFSTQLNDHNNNRILESGEEVKLIITVENKGEGVARGVVVALSGTPLLVNLFGEKRLIGDIGAREKKTIVFKAVIPARISTETANLRILVNEGGGFSPAEAKTLRVALRAVEV
ncbi:MAG: hypothetical protein CVU74_08730, partial [Deltaproteobacteria bacterium HGW-Deltaproteobacteria-9]